MRWRTSVALLVALPLAACLDADLTLRADGSVAGTISWTSTSKLPEQGARALLAAKDVTVKQVELKEAEIPAAKPGGATSRGQRVSAQIEAKSVAALTAIPLFKSLGVSASVASPQASQRTLVVRAARNEHLGSTPETDSVVRLHFPGPVVQSSATASGTEVTWKIAAADFRSKPSVEMSAIYTEAPAPPAAANASP